MSETRVILLCSSRLALPAMQQLLFLNLLAVVVVPKHTDEMVENVQFLLKQTTVPILIVEQASFANEILDAIEKYEVNLGLMISFSFLLPAKVFKATKHGFYNVHPGPLPQYRGADPIFQQIKNKEKQAGICIHQVSQAFDSGPIAMQEMIRLLPTDTYGMLTTKLAQLAAKLIITLLKLLSFDVAIPVKEQELSNSRYFKKHTGKDVLINWEDMDSKTITALVNACNPWNKGATTLLNGRIVRILEADVIVGHSYHKQILPATILSFQYNKLLVATKDGGTIGISSMYQDEGFLSVDRLPSVGVVVGLRFDTVRN